MRLVATYTMHYGRKKPMDGESPLIPRGEEFEVEPTSIASSEEVGRFMIRAGSAMTPEAWAKRKPISNINADLAAEFVAKARAAYLNQQTKRGA